MCFAVIAAAAFAASAGQVYKWVDANGRVHFSDTPRPGWKAVDLNAPGTAEAAAAAAEPTAEDETDAVTEAGDAATDAAVEDEGAGADAAISPQLRAEECTRAREQLESYRNATKIVERDAEGKEKEYSTSERLQLIQQTQQRVTELCSPQPG
ncbi:MAG: DUF4124 domain-containing protein [Gammaproteobacteria bacterium]